MAAQPAPAMVKKRDDYLSWDEYFMAVCCLSSLRSKDPHKQVGACIVNGNNHIIGIGYNGFPRGCSDEALPWAREGNPLDTKYPYVCHVDERGGTASRAAVRHACDFAYTTPRLRRSTLRCGRMASPHGCC